MHTPDPKNHDLELAIENRLELLEAEKAVFAEQLLVMKEHCRKLDDDVYAGEDELSRKRLELNSLSQKIAAQKSQLATFTENLARETEARRDAEARVLRLTDALTAVHLASAATNKPG